MNNFNNMNGQDNFSQFQSNYPNLSNTFMQPVQPPKSNKLVVSTLEEAVNKPVQLNTCIVYHTANGEMEFEVLTDANGNKSYNVYKRVLQNVTKSTEGISRDEFLVLKEQIKNLETAIGGLLNGKPNGINNANTTSS